MSIVSSWLRTPRIRRGLAASMVVVASGGLVLFRADASSVPVYTVTPSPKAHAASFAGNGLHGTLALSQTQLLPGQRMYAELDVVADARPGAQERAPLAIAVVLDTSGSMMGEKISRAKDSVVRLVEGMRDDDEIAFVRYSDDAELVQPLTRVGHVRDSLIDRIQAVEAGGGTAIPRGLSAGLGALSEVSGGRVRRVVLVSDGLDSTRAESERLASDAFEHGVIVSSMGIGLDFDSAYMGSVARSGHGNFAFVKDASTLGTFLARELKETAGTTVEDATVRLTLPHGIRLASASGADARTSGLDGEVELKIGSLFAGDERRVLLELTTSLDPGDAASIEGRASWRRVGGGEESTAIPRLGVLATRDEAAATASRDGAVLASATSVLASRRQLEAAEAYERGDTRGADALIQQNLDQLKQAAAAAPPAAATALDSQWREYAATKSGFAHASPSSAVGKALPKAAAAKDIANMTRSSY
jgi:Ca-activated chloride channel family protein